MRSPSFRRLRAGAAALAVASGLAFAGCESAENAPVKLSASRRDLSAVGDTSVLVASGWGRYRWTLSDSSIGRLSATTGSRVVYTATKMPAEGSAYLNQTVTCQAMDPGSGLGAFSTVTLRHVSLGGSATPAKPSNSANVTPSPSGGGETPSGDTLRLSPSSYTMNAQRSRSTSTRVSVSSPSSNRAYSWQLREASLGRLSSGSGTSVTYYAPTDAEEGAVQTVVCTEGGTGRTGTCTITLHYD